MTAYATFLEYCKIMRHLLHNYRFAKTTMIRGTTQQPKDVNNYTQTYMLYINTHIPNKLHG